MDTGTLVAVLGVASTLAFTAIAALTIRDWFATKGSSRMYLALAIGCLAAVSILGQAAKLLGITRGSLRNKLRDLGITIARTVEADEEG